MQTSVQVSSSKLSAAAKEFVPSSVDQSFPALKPISHSSLDLKQEAEKALNRKNYKNKRYIVAVISTSESSSANDSLRTLQTPTRAPTLATIQPCTPHIPQQTILRTVSEASQKWKSKWIQAAREANEKEQARKQNAKAVEVSEEEEKRKQSNTSEKSWHTYLQPCNQTLWKNLDDWSFPKTQMDSQDSDDEEVAVSGAFTTDTQNRSFLDLEAIKASIGIKKLDEADEILSPLMLCSKYGSEMMLEQLLQQPTKYCNAIDLRDRRLKKTALLLAIELGRLESAKILLKYGASLDVKDRGGDTALHKAVKSSNASMTAWLCGMDKKIVKINARNKRLETPLLLCQSREIAMLLLSAGADPSVLQCDGWNIQSMASRAGNVRLLECVLMSNNSCTNFHRGNNTEQTAVPITTPLHQAAINGNLDCLRLVLLSSNDLMLDSVDAGGQGMTALQYAALLGRANVIQLLLEANANVWIEDSQSATALVLAALHQNRVCLEILARHSKSTYRLNSLGENALECLLRLLFSSCSAGPSSSSIDDKRRIVIDRISADMDIILDMIVLGHVLTDKCLKRLVPIASVSFFKEIGLMFEDPTAYFQDSTSGPAIVELCPGATQCCPLQLTFFGTPRRDHIADKRQALQYLVVDDAALASEDILHSGHDVKIVMHSDDASEVSGNTSDVTILAHRSILSEMCPKLNAMIQFTERQHSQNDAPAPFLTTLSFQGNQVRKRSFLKLVHFFYTSSIETECSESSCSTEKDAEDECLFDLLWLSDEFLVKPLTTQLESLMQKRLALSGPKFPLASVYFYAATSLGLNSLRATAAYALLRSLSVVPGDMPLAELALRSLLNLED